MTNDEAIKKINNARKRLMEKTWLSLDEHEAFDMAIAALKGNQSLNNENLKELMFYRKAIKILKESDRERKVWYISPDGEIGVMYGNTVILLLNHGIYKFYDTYEEAKRAIGKHNE